MVRSSFFYLIVAVAVFVGGLLQTQPLVINNWGLKGDFVLVLVVALTLVRGLREGLVWAFVGGLYLDFLQSSATAGGSGLLGVNSLLLLIVALAASLGQNNVFEANLIMPLATTAVATVVYRLILLAVVNLTYMQESFTTALVRQILPSLIINTLLAPLLYSLIGWLSRRFSPQLPSEWQLCAVISTLHRSTSSWSSAWCWWVCSWSTSSL